MKLTLIDFLEVRLVIDLVWFVITPLVILVLVTLAKAALLSVGK